MDNRDLLNPSINKLFDTEIGFYKIYHCFATYYISESLFDEKKVSLVKNSDKELIKNFIHNIVFFLKLLLKKKKSLYKTDILFISRYREKQVELIKTDYLFDSILNYTDNHYDSALLSLNHFDHYNRPNNKNYNLMDGVTPVIIIKSILTSLTLRIKFELIKSNLKSNMKDSIISFFSMKNLFLWCLNGFTLKNIYKKLKPSIMVANDEIQILKPSNEKIKLITVQSANINEKLEEKRFELLSIFVPEEKKADVFCMSGPFYQSLKEKYLAEAKKIVITGQPRFDELIEVKRKYEKQLKPKERSEIKLLWVTETQGLSLEENKRNIMTITNVLKKMPHVTLNIKLHPAEDQDAPLYAPLEKRFNNVKILKGKSNLWESLLACDITIIKSSTSVIEAAILGKNIIILDLSDKNPEGYIDYVKEGVGIGVYEEEHLENAIKSIINDKNLSEDLKKSREKFIHKYNYFNDAKSSLRVFEIIDKFFKV